jgi:hypothetical protein
MQRKLHSPTRRLPDSRGGSRPCQRCGGPLAIAARAPAGVRCVDCGDEPGLRLEPPRSLVAVKMDLPGRVAPAPRRRVKTSTSRRVPHAPDVAARLARLWAAVPRLWRSARRPTATIVIAAAAVLGVAFALLATR